MARWYSNLLSFTLLFALVVIVLGAYTRLADAGLGCPDWPGCYGSLTVPDEAGASSSGFERPLEPAKAWAEMIHRYVAGALGLLILGIFLLAVFKPEVRERSGIMLPLVLLCTVIFQALLGMWTVTKLLSPVIVTAHLIGGFTTLSLLWLLWLKSWHHPAVKYPKLETGKGFKALGGIALLAVVLQIVLGGWTSTNYAAIACGTSYPDCHGSLWPEADFAQGFSMDQQMQEGVDYEFGILQGPARTAIHMMHRTGAIVVLLIVGLLGFCLLLANRDRFAGLAITTLALLGGQITLGILNVVMALPLVVATAHNLVAALLLLALVALNYRFIIGR